MDERSRYLADSRRSAHCFLAVLLLALQMTGVHAAVPPSDQTAILGAHTLLTQAGGLGTAVATSASINTQERGSSLLVLVGGYTNNTKAPTDTDENVWTQRGAAVAYHGFDGRFIAKAYVASAAKGGPGHTVSFVKDGTPAGEITAPFVEIKQAGMLQAVAQNYATPSLATRAANKLARIWQASGAGSSNATVTSDSVTTTGPATLVAVWWGDSRALNMTAVPNNSFKIIERYLNLPPESGVQCAVAVRQVAEAGTYDVTWTDSPAQGAILWLFAFQSEHRPRASAENSRAQSR